MPSSLSTELSLSVARDCLSASYWDAPGSARDMWQPIPSTSPLTACLRGLTRRWREVELELGYEELVVLRRVAMQRIERERALAEVCLWRTFCLFLTYYKFNHTSLTTKFDKFRVFFGYVTLINNHLSIFCLSFLSKYRIFYYYTYDIHTCTL